jgi:hypothetical protein
VDPEFQLLSENWQLNLLKNRDLISEKVYEEIIEKMREKLLTTEDENNNETQNVNSEQGGHESSRIEESEAFKRDLLKQLTENNKQHKLSLVTRTSGRTVKTANTVSSACLIQ